MLTVNEVAQRLKGSRWSVYRWIKSGKLTALKLNGGYRIRQEDLDVFIAKAVTTQSKAKEG